MKKYILTLCTLIATMGAGAQSNLKVRSIDLRNGSKVDFTPEKQDSVRIVFTPEGDTLGIKVYEQGKEAQDFLYSQTERIVFYETPAAQNTNRNTAADLQRNPQAWRMEFPRLYQGSNPTYEVTHSTAQYGITYSLEWDGNKRAQRWTCYQFSADTPDNNVGRNDDWKEDTQIPSQYRTSGSDYSGSGFSRGHMCASSDRQSSTEQNRQTFYYSNMQPQWQPHNGGQWNRLEMAVQAWGKNRNFCDTLYVVKAATIDKPEQIIRYTQSGLPVPKYFYMCLLAVKNGKYKAIGFWTEHKNENESNPIADYAKSIDEIEQLTGIDFFCNLPDAIEQEVERSYNMSDWR